MHESATLPGHDAISPVTRTIEVCSLAAALALVIANAGHAVSAGLLAHWWAPMVVVAAALAADLVSGLVHWTADTWFSETMPVLGRRFLRPFRVHHVNPGDFLRRDFVDCNGDVAMLNLPILTIALVLPVTNGFVDAGALALMTFAVVSLPTNQVHQWAHMPSPPPAVRWLQRQGVILSADAHAQHHREPYVANYCIATGWCNRWLTAVDFFPRCERLVTRVAGLEPREDENAFEGRW
jgi:ubiquitin-conjugating enzyme E2 variant